MKLENFEKEYTQEIETLKSVKFQIASAPRFAFPGYSIMYKKTLSLVFAVPAALVLVFGFVFYNQSQSPYNQNLSLLEESNDRILNEINNIDNESNI